MQTTQHQTQPVKTRSPKGSVTLQERKYDRRFKYTADKKRRHLSLPAKGTHSKAFEDSLKKTIELDLLLNRHDHTQQRYKRMIETGIIPFIDNNIVFAPVTQYTAPASPVAVTTFVPASALTAHTKPAITGIVTVPIEPANDLQEPEAVPEPTAENETAPAEKKTALQKRNEKRANRKIVFVNLPRLDQPFLLQDVVVYYCQQNGRDEDINYYKGVRDMAKKWGKVQAFQIPTLLNNQNYEYETYQNRRTMISGMFTYLVDNGHIATHPFKYVPARTKPEVKPVHRQRISDALMYDVLQAIKDDTYQSKYSHRVKHSYYYPVILFLATIGTRPAEAIGLQVKKVNFDNNTVVIDQALARVTGTYAAGREMKETKTGNKRTITIESPELLAILKELCEGKEPNDYVFQSINGLSIDEASLRRVLTAVLEALKIDHKVLYFLRHCVISRCLQQGMDILEVIKLVGHKDKQMVLNVYGEITGNKVAAPGIDKKNKL
jgi:integrase